MSSKRLWIALGSCMTLSACNTAYTHIADEDPGIGEAVKYDAAIHTVNPAPVYTANSTQPGSNGEVGAAAAKRYRTDHVKAPAEVGTSSTGSTSGSGAGMSSGGGPH